MTTTSELLDDTVATEDAFRRKPFAQRLARTIVERKDTGSIAIGVYGPWGDGKSSVLGFISAELEKPESKCIVINFNPWRFPTEEKLIEMFFAELTAAVNEQIERTPKQKLGDWARGWLDSKWVKTGVKWAAGLGGLKGENVDELINRKVEEERARLEGVLEKLGVKLVFLIDDIDRLDPGEIHAVFRLVKLSANFKRTVFLLAFDYDIVAAALGTRFATGGGAENGRKYIEKIVQIPVELPKIDPQALSDYLFGLLDKTVDPPNALAISPSAYQQFREGFQRLFLPRLPTPRMCKRYVNAVQFAAGMLGRSVNGVDVLAIEGLRIGYPTVYAAVREHKRHFAREGRRHPEDAEQLNQERKGLVSAALASIDSPIQQRACEEIVAGLFAPGVAPGFRAVCRSGAFPAYFSYVAPDSDPNWDRPLAFFDAALAGRQEAASAIWEELLERLNPQAKETLQHLFFAGNDTENERVIECALAVAERRGQTAAFDEFVNCIYPLNATDPQVVASPERWEDARQRVALHAVSRSSQFPIALQIARNYVVPLRTLCAFFQAPRVLKNTEYEIKTDYESADWSKLAPALRALRSAFAATYLDKSGGLIQFNEEVAFGLAVCAADESRWGSRVIESTVTTAGRGRVNELFRHAFERFRTTEDIAKYRTWLRFRCCSLYARVHLTDPNAAEPLDWYDLAQYVCALTNDLKLWEPVLPPDWFDRLRVSPTGTLAAP